jgi:hypothetical protein
VCTHCLLCSKVINERPCYAQAAFLARSTTAACAIRLDWFEVFSERRVLEIEDSSCSDSIPEPLKTIIIAANSFTHSNMLNLPLSLLAKRSRTCLPQEQSQQEDPLGSPEGSQPHQGALAQFTLQCPSHISASSPAEGRYRH